MYQVKDLDESIGFYTNVLGLTQVWRDDDRHMIGLKMEKGEGEIVIQSDPSLPKFDYSFLVEDVELFCKQTKDSGYSVAVDPFDVRCGKYAVLLDTDKNEIPIIDLTKFGGVPKYD